MSGSADRPALPVVSASDAQAIRHVAVIGAGVIGASWATVFLAHGLSLTVSDPHPDAERALRETIAAQWPTMPSPTLPLDAALALLRVAPTPEEAAAGADFVQENAPEGLELKCELLGRLDAAAPAGTIIATSSSTLMVSELQGACRRHPERLVLGHPFNPPHLIPLVEVSGGKATSPAAVERTLRFYEALGKRPIHLRREVRGHIANRLQAALWREAFHLVATGVASVADIDAAISEGPGLRWALLGPFQNLHLSGGPGGIATLFDKPLWQATEAIWRDLGSVPVEAGLATLVAEQLSGNDMDSMVRRRDAALSMLLRLKTEMAGQP
jgi:3-hydroxyacyl-CoA dehydrogenase